MECYQCLQAGVTREAAGLCHHCSAALCADHNNIIQNALCQAAALVGCALPTGDTAP